MTFVDNEKYPFPDYELPTPDKLPGRTSYRDALVARVPGYRPLMLDLDISADAADPVPVVVWIHGGAWMFGTNKHCAGPIPTELMRDQVLARGWAFAAIQYRLSGEAPGRHNCTTSRAPCAGCATTPRNWASIPRRSRPGANRPVATSP